MKKTLLNVTSKLAVLYIVWRNVPSTLYLQTVKTVDFQGALSRRKIWIHPIQLQNAILVPCIVAPTSPEHVPILDVCQMLGTYITYLT